MHIQTFKHLQIVSTFHHSRKYPYSLQGCGLRKITRNQKVPNYEILGTLHLSLYEKRQFFQLPKRQKIVICGIWVLLQHSPAPQKGLEFPGDGRVLAVWTNCMKLNWNFQRGGHVLEKIPFVWQVWIFSGATHFLIKLEKVFNS